MLLAAACALFARAGEAPADDVSSLQGKLNELQSLQAQEGPLRTTIDRQNAEVNALIGRESAVRQHEAAVQADLDAKQADLDRATKELRAERAHLRKVRAHLQRAVGALKKLLVRVYMHGTPDTLSVVLKSASWSDVLSETEYLDRIQNYDDTVIARVSSLRDEIGGLVSKLDASRDRVKAARDAIRARRDEVASARKQIESQHAALVAARQARQGTLNALLERERSLARQISPSAAPPGGSATLLPNGDALPPAGAPLAVRAAIEAANQINETPYIWGGGHGSFNSPGYDCSGAVSYALHGGGLLSSPLDSSGLQVWGAPGGGSWITVYANTGHAFAMIAGLRWDTVGGGNGPRWYQGFAPESPSSFIARHAPGL